MGMATYNDYTIDDAFRGRFVVRHLCALCKGGCFLISAYFRCSEAASPYNLDFMQAIAKVVRQIHGPWLLAADFNFPPSVLRKTGWLGLVGGHIVATTAATCKGAEDHFVVDVRLKSAVVGIALVNDTGAGPHSAVRMWVRGRPRDDMVRSVKSPPEARPCMPLGCLPQFSTQDWESVIDVKHPELFNAHTLNAGFAKCITMVEEQLAHVMGLQGVVKDKFCVRAAGTQVQTKNALGKVSAGGRKLSAVTIAWKNLFLWLPNLAVACSPRAKTCHLLAAERGRYLLRFSCWDHLGCSRHAQAVKAWCGGITDWHLRDRASLNWLRANWQNRQLRQAPG